MYSSRMSVDSNPAHIARTALVWMNIFTTVAANAQHRDMPISRPASTVVHGAAAGAKPIYAILGGSNTLGAKNIKPTPGKPWVSYARQLAGPAGLGNNYTAMWSAQGAMGPTLNAACSDTFIPPGTRFVTLEFLPNMGYTGDDEAEASQIEQLLSTARYRRAHTVLVLITPGNERLNASTCEDREHMSGCTTVAHIRRLRERLVTLADRYGAKHIILDCDESVKTRKLFGEDAMHVNQEGHDLIFKQIQEFRKDWLELPEPSASDIGNAINLGVKCYVGDDLAPLIKHTRGFSRIDMARPEQGASKIGWEATLPGSSMTICTSLPRKENMAAEALHDLLHFAHAKAATATHAVHGIYMMAVGMQVSHALNQPLFGRFELHCRGACNCTCYYSEHQPTVNCSWDTLTKGRSTVTNFFRVLVQEDGLEHTTTAAAAAATEAAKPCERDQCVVEIRNAGACATPVPPASEVGFRVVTRGLIIGLRDWRTGWLNTNTLDNSGIRGVRV